MKFKSSKMFFAALSAATVLATTSYAQVADTAPLVQVAVTPLVSLQLEVTSNCTDKGVVFKIFNRGTKWPQTGFLRFYAADSKTLLREHRLRLLRRQTVSFVVEDETMKGSPIAVWVDPQWYERKFEFDANVSCG